MDTCSRKYTGTHMDNSSFGIRVGGNYMKYEEPIIAVMELEKKDIVRTSNTPGYNWGGDNDEDFV